MRVIGKPGQSFLKLSPAHTESKASHTESILISASFSSSSMTWSYRSKISCLSCLFSCLIASTSTSSSSTPKASLKVLHTQISNQSFQSLANAFFTYFRAYDSLAGSWYMRSKVLTNCWVMSGWVSKYALKALGTEPWPWLSTWVFCSSTASTILTNQVNTFIITINWKLNPYNHLPEY